MAYTPKTWECGETITADALNHLEQGVASAGGGAEPLIVNCTSTVPQTLDKTWQEIYDAPMAWLEGAVAPMPGGTATHKYPLSDISVLQPTGGEPRYGVSFGGANSEFDFVTDDANGYPAKAFH